ncbi:ATP synthase F1 subunit gamma [Candidatus Falkowbacteria bacterium]|uniref:ATP synthase F1 subunit gamma n=1 Tax=Candidatus Buchananbacteria bacterium CG10_big_fil_rev_8_21_14_0_10_33_19 TaxID=1974525 RepID=A0A2H0W773_9BACT|nr:ATP synthase F1 subunit gamma [Candidatus Falkowbacteria bacterium]PIS06441.1 MAG: ATP synthase F1 subunit gamma [Candidatus Buchananbacteria bacterium CG10_big_fil_rev_8_21_14_0_10_33_19]
MASLLEIKNQINGIKNTKKITKAMQLVAAAKSRQFQTKAISIRNFAFDLLYILANNPEDLSDSSFLKNRDQGQTIFILYSSDKGLCGALNQQLFRAFIQSKVWQELKSDQRQVITIGRKATNFIKFQGIEPLQSFENLDEKMNQYEALNHISKIVDYWNNSYAKKIYMVAPHYRNSFTFYPIIKQFLPLSDNILQSHIGVHPEVFTKKIRNNRSRVTLYEPSEDLVAERLIEDIINVLFLQAFYDLKASEYSSRMIAMQSATDNADKLIKGKSLLMNKIRQAAITQEISEIVGASFI